MSTNANPYIVWQRIKMDVYRLSSAAKRSGNGSLIADTQKLIEVLNNFAELQALSPIPPHFDVTPTTNDQSVHKVGTIKFGGQDIMGGICYQRGEPFNADQSPEWQKGWLLAQSKANSGE